MGGARALGESIFTEADEIESLHQQVREAVHCHFEEGNAPNLTVSQSDQGMQCKAKSGEKAEFTYSIISR